MARNSSDSNSRTAAVLDPSTLRASAALLGAQIALGGAIERGAVSQCPHDSTTLDMLLRLELSERGALRSVELCRQLLLSPSHISRMIDRAEGDGLVERQPDPDDRRAQQVVITDAGNAAVAEFVPHLNAVIQRVINENLTADEIDVLVELLSRIEQAATTEAC
jgi:DNA-binding MarR family transcriptional regulator